MKRIVQPEILDALTPGDPRAVRSRRDLRRVNAWMGNDAIMARALEQNWDGPAPEQIAELGAGDGTFLLRVARRLGAFGVPPSGGSDRLKPELQTQQVNVALLDRQKIVSAETLAAFAAHGWRVEVLVADVFDWPQSESNVLVANLFLHHFHGALLGELLGAIARRAKLFIALEPRRAAWPLFCSRLLWAMGCNDVTRHDAVVSIRAGFSGKELSSLWPEQQGWKLTEQSAGAFSHLFIAQKIN